MLLDNLSVCRVSLTLLFRSKQLVCQTQTLPTSTKTPLNLLLLPSEIRNKIWTLAVSDLRSTMHIKAQLTTSLIIQIEVQLSTSSVRRNDLRTRNDHRDISDVNDLSYGVDTTTQLNLLFLNRQILKEAGYLYRELHVRVSFPRADSSLAFSRMMGKESCPYVP